MTKLKSSEELLDSVLASIGNVFSRPLMYSLSARELDVLLNCHFGFWAWIVGKGLRLAAAQDDLCKEYGWPYFSAAEHFFREDPSRTESEARDFVFAIYRRLANSIYLPILPTHVPPQDAKDSNERVWVFLGGGGHPSAVFRSRESAEVWIAGKALTGTLTAYPLDTPVYDWAIAHGCFTPQQDYQLSPKFVAGFSSASLEHYHYTDGKTEE